MTIDVRTIVNFHAGAEAVTNETANNSSTPILGTIFADIVDTTNAATGVSVASQTIVPSTSVGDATPGGATLTDQQINNGGWYHQTDINGPFTMLLTFPVGQAAVDIDVYNDVDGTFAGQDDMTAQAVGLTTVSQNLTANIGSTNPNGEFFTLANVTPDASNQIAISVQNNGAGSRWAMMNGIVLTPTAGAVPAVISLPTSVNTDTTITPSFSTDTIAGTAYCVAVANGATAPTAPQIIAGTDSADQLTFNSNVLVATSPDSLPALTGLSPSTGYDVYIVQVTAGGNSNIISIINIITDAATTTQTSFDLFDNQAVPVALNTIQFDYTIYDAWGATELASGTFTTNAVGGVSITGLTNVPAGPAYISIRQTLNNNIVSHFPITVI